MRKRIRYYIYFFVAALFLQLIALLKKIMDPPSTLDLTLYSETYALDEFAILQYGALFYFVIGLSYWVFRILRRKLNHTLSAIHTFTTVGSLMLYALSILMSEFFEQDNYSTYFEHNETMIMILLPIVVIAQFLYLINIVNGLMFPSRKHKRKIKEY